MRRLPAAEFDRIYQAYMVSPEWKAFRERYFRSRMPNECLGCETERDITLHHITYNRLGRESLIDVAPLCFRCHKRLHKVYQPRDLGPESPIHRLRHQLRSVFGLSHKEADRRLAPWYLRLSTAPNHQGDRTERRKRFKDRKRRLREQDHEHEPDDW